MDNYNLLSCAGGGYFGYGEILILQELEKISGKQSYQIFDAMAGTSAGAINTSALSIGVAASCVLDFYTKWAAKIFVSDGFAAKLHLSPKYNSSELTAALKTILAIKDSNGNLRNSTLKDCKVNWMATALNMTTGLPTFFCSWLKSEDVIVNGTTLGSIVGYDSPLELWEIVLCSTAAPTYFPGEKFGSVYIDGGLTGCNSPDSILIDFVTDLSNGKQVKMLSLGSGDSKWTIDPESMITPSDIHVAFVVLNTFLAAGVDSSNVGAYMKLKNNYFHLSPYYDPNFEMDDIETGSVKIPEATKVLLDKYGKALSDFLNT